MKTLGNIFRQFLGWMVFFCMLWVVFSIGAFVFGIVGFFGFVAVAIILACLGVVNDWR